MRTVINTKELPMDIQALLKTEYGFSKLTVTVIPTIEFTCPTPYSDYTTVTLVAYNQTTGQHKAIRSGNYESHMNWSPEEHAMYSGKMKTTIQDPTTWFFVLESKNCTVYCHPLAIAKALAAPKLELPRRQQIVLFITRSMISSYRLEEARHFKFTMSEWNTCKAELFKLGLMRANGSLTTEGKNAAQGLMFNTWEENK